jgi:hypothetical protein
MKGVQSMILDSITYKDVQHIMHNGYVSFFKSYNWPFRKIGKKIQLYDTEWYDITIEMVDMFIKSIFKKIEQMFIRYVEVNQWLSYDPECKYPKYSLIIYGKKPLIKIKSLLYKKNTVY